MRPFVCRICGRRFATRRTRFKYCGDCYAHFFADDAKLGHVPRNHPFIKAREARIEAMRRRAAERAPLFEADAGRSLCDPGAP